MHFTQVLAIPTADKCYVKHGWIAVLVDRRCMAHRYKGVQYNVMSIYEGMRGCTICREKVLNKLEWAPKTFVYL